MLSAAWRHVAASSKSAPRADVERYLLGELAVRLD
jgi:hypothetical protein